MSKDEMSFYKLKTKDSRYTKDETPRDEVGRHRIEETFSRVPIIYMGPIIYEGVNNLCPNLVCNDIWAPYMKGS